MKDPDFAFAVVGLLSATLILAGLVIAALYSQLVARLRRENSELRMERMFLRDERKECRGLLRKFVKDMTDGVTHGNDPDLLAEARELLEEGE